MKNTIFRITTAALLTFGAASTQALAATQSRNPYPYSYERRSTFEQRAFDNGERDGYSKGIDDIRHHRRADINRQKWYRNGDHDFDRHWGSRDAYRMDYRQGFERGYDRAYREGYREAYREGWRR